MQSITEEQVTDDLLSQLDFDRGDNDPAVEAEALLYASLTALDAIRIPSSLCPAVEIHLGKGVWGAAGGCYRRVDGDLLAWMNDILLKQAEEIDGDVADPGPHLRSVDFFHRLRAEASDIGILQSAEPPADFRIQFKPPVYCSSFLTE